MFRSHVHTLAGILLVSLVAWGCSSDDNPVGTGDGEADESGLRAVITASPTSVPAGDDHSTVVTISAENSDDPEGEELTYSWTVQLGTFVNGTDSNDETIQVTFPGVTPYAVTLTVTDPDGNTDSASATIGLEGDGGIYGKTG